MSIRVQHCEYCGKELGEFAWSRRLDGPLTCGGRECEREVRHEEQAERDDAAARASEDDFGRYRGGW